MSNPPDSPVKRPKPCHMMKIYRREYDTQGRDVAVYLAENIDPYIATLLTRCEKAETAARELRGYVVAKVPALKIQGWNIPVGEALLKKTAWLDKEDL